MSSASRMSREKSSAKASSKGTYVQGGEGGGRESTFAQRILEHTSAVVESQSAVLQGLNLEIHGSVKMVQGKDKQDKPRKPKLNTYQRVVEPLRTWLMFDEKGNLSTLQKEKQTIASAFGLALRDLRILDPHLATSYPSAILCRDNCMVVSLEHVKCIIGTNRVLVHNIGSEAVMPFIEELQRRLAAHFDRINDPLNEEPEAPYELAALEVALESVAKYMEGLTADLEQKTHLALDELTARVNSLNLQRLRNIKSLLSRLTTRVETLREVLEKYLDDDDDMKEMYLSKKILLEQSSGASARALTVAGINLRKLQNDHEDMVSRLFAHQMPMDQLDAKLVDKMARMASGAAPLGPDGMPLPRGSVGGAAGALPGPLGGAAAARLGPLAPMSRSASAKQLTSMRSMDVNLAAGIAGRGPGGAAAVGPPLGAGAVAAGGTGAGAAAWGGGLPPVSGGKSVKELGRSLLGLGSRIRELTPTLSSTLVAEPQYEDRPGDALSRASKTSVGGSRRSSQDIGTDSDAAAKSHKSHKSGRSSKSSKSSRSSRSSSSYRSEVESMIEEVEELLEGYFMLLDNSWNKLRTLNQLIEDTEDYIAIELDTHRNQLVSIDLVITIATFCATLIAAVASIFGQNLVSPMMPDVVGVDRSIFYFKLVTTTTCCLAIVLFLVIMWYVRFRKILPNM